MNPDIQYQGGMQQETVVVNIVPAQELHFDLACRVCGNENDRNIHTCGTEGQNYEGALKMNTYLPVTLTDNDKLPLNCCRKCLSTTPTQRPEVEPEAVLPHDEQEGITSVSLRTLYSNHITMPDITSSRDTSKVLSPVVKEEDLMENTHLNEFDLSKMMNISPNLEKENWKQMKIDPYLDYDMSETLTPKIDIGETEIRDYPQESNMEDTHIKVELTETMNASENLEKNEDDMKIEHETLAFPTEYLQESNINDTQMQDFSSSKICNNQTVFKPMSDNYEMLKYDSACKYCDVKFANDKDVLRHIKQQHPNEIEELEKEKSKNTEIDKEAINAAKVMTDKKVYTCKVCEKKFLNPVSYSRHFRLHLKMNKGEISNKTSDNEETLKYNFGCDYCGAIFVKFKDISRHVREKHQNEGDGMNIIGNLEQKEKMTQTINLSSLDVGIKECAQQNNIENKHNEEVLNYNFACEYCGAIFVEDSEVLQHIRESHPSENDSSETINICQKPETKIKRKRTKIDQEAVDAAKVTIDNKVCYRCKVCGKILFNPYTYSWHIRIHTGERPYVCDLCGKQFRVSQGLARHLRETHQGIKKCGCDICGRMFTTQRNVREHRRIHTNERPYVCDLCGKAFKQKAALFVHNRSHTDHFPYQCSVCDLKFRTKPTLEAHVSRRHTDEKPYPCKECGMSFRVKYELKTHMLVHSDAKPFVCALCGLSFRQKRYLKNHMKNMHNKIWSRNCIILPKNE